MREFDWIARYFAPLTDGVPGALGLRDDAAVIAPPPGQDLVTTVDTIVAGRHFLDQDPPDLIARKLMRVNLSDLAAMGAHPAHGFLSTAWPKDITEDWIAGFAQGLAADQGTFGLMITGGDTVATDGPLTLTLTALGWVPTGTALRRSGAQAGEGLYVSGTIGDSGLGLGVLTGRIAPCDTAHVPYLTERYRVPEPRVSLGAALRGLAGAAMDISDGLVQDAGHLARASGVDLVIEADAVPFSPAAWALLDTGQADLAALITAGDDYELLFTLPDGHNPIPDPTPVTRIGRVVPGRGQVHVIGSDGAPMSLPSGGYRHF